jgi:hypothetical protein
MDRARATTQRGADICTVTLKVDSASTQQAPPISSANMDSGSSTLTAVTAALKPKPMLDQETITSVEN